MKIEKLNDTPEWKRGALPPLVQVVEKINEIIDFINEEVSVVCDMHEDISGTTYHEHTEQPSQECYCSAELGYKCHIHAPLSYDKELEELAEILFHRYGRDSIPYNLQIEDKKHKWRKEAQVILSHIKKEGR